MRNEATAVWASWFRMVAEQSQRTPIRNEATAVWANWLRAVAERSQRASLRNEPTAAQAVSIRGIGGVRGDDGAEICSARRDPPSRLGNRTDVIRREANVLPRPVTVSTLQSER